MAQLFIVLFAFIFSPVYTRAQATEDIAAVEAGLGDPDFRARRQALGKLGGMKHARRPELLRKALADQDPEVRERSARLLGASRDKTAYKTLTDALAAADDATRGPLIDGLGDLGDKRAAQPLAALMTHKDRNTRWKAAKVLGLLKSDNGVAALQRAASRDGDRYVRQTAVESLGRIGSARSRAALTALRAGGDKELAAWAAKVLEVTAAK